MKYFEIAKEILESNYAAVGVRSVCADENYAIGEDCRESFDWDFEADCSTYHTSGLTANGTCATHIDTQYFATEDQVTELAVRIEAIIKENSQYCGDQIIIAGNSVYNDGSNDPGEIRIRNAFVIAI